jgi:hypothetical protein
MLSHRFRRNGFSARYTKQDNPSFLQETDPICLWSKDKHEFNGESRVQDLNVNANYDTQSTFAFQNLLN